MELNAKILPDGRWQAFVRDISERKRAEARQLRSELGGEEQFRLIFEEAPIGVALVRSTGALTRNGALCDILGVYGRGAGTALVYAGDHAAEELQASVRMGEGVNRGEVRSTASRNATSARTAARSPSL